MRESYLRTEIVFINEICWKVVNRLKLYGQNRNRNDVVNLEKKGIEMMKTVA